MSEPTAQYRVGSWAYRPFLCRWGYRLRLITYCVLCDGSMNEARERGQRFRADRWRFHRKHERATNPGPLFSERKRP